MLLPNRHGNSSDYRYGFGGKESDDELKGEGNSYDYGARMYDPRIGRWFATDRDEWNYPFVSPYAFALNNPIAFYDPDGNYVRGDKTKSMSSFFRVFKEWENEASKLKYRKSRARRKRPNESENHAKIRLFDEDFRAMKQRINTVGKNKNFSYNKSFGKYLDAGLPLDVSHFFKMANLAQDYPDPIVRAAYINEEFNQAEDKRPAGRTSAFAPEDLFSNELGVIFGDNAENYDDLGVDLQGFMGDVKTLFTTNELKGSKYLSEKDIGRLRDIAMKYYGTTDLTTFKKDSDIYKLSEIKKINDNAQNRDYPFYKGKEESKGKNKKVKKTKEKKG